jgi:hypothetical protein
MNKVEIDFKKMNVKNPRYNQISISDTNGAVNFLRGG